MEEPASFRVVVENFSVAAPVERGLELPLHFVGAEMFVEDVAEELFPDGVVALGMQGVFDQPQNGNMSSEPLRGKLLSAI